MVTYGLGQYWVTDSEQELPGELYNGVAGFENVTDLTIQARKLEDDDDYDAGAHIMSAAISCVITIIVHVAILVLFAHSYFRSVHSQRAAFPAPSDIPEQYSLKNGKDFFFRWSGCCDDCQYCLHGCIYPVAAADRWAITGVDASAKQYWPTIWVFLLFDVIMNIFQAVITIVRHSLSFGNDAIRVTRAMRSVQPETSVYYIVNAALALWAASKRQNLREKLGGMKVDFLNDWICWWCCACCTSIQEARQVDAIQNVRVNCCCQLVGGGTAMAAGPYAAYAGQPVAIGQVVGQPVQPAVVVGQVVPPKEGVETNYAGGENNNVERPT